MLKFFLLERGQWNSDLSAAECSARLGAEIESTFDILPRDGGLAGIAGGDWARVRRRRFARNDFAPVLVLTFVPVGAGTKVEYAIGPSLFARGFSIVWLFMVARFAPYTWPPTPVVLVPVGMILFFVGLMFIGRMTGRSDGDWLLKRVADILRAHPAPTGA